MIGNIITILIIVIISIFKDNITEYFRMVPQNDLMIISVQINIWTMVLFFIGFKGGDVLVNELGSPVFRIYDTDCKIISDFTKNELNFLIMQTHQRLLLQKQK